MSRVVSEPHSTKQFEDLVGWGLETDPETLIDTVPGIAEPTEADAEAICRAVRCPVLVVHGDADAVTPYSGGVAVAAWTGGSLVSIPGGGHAPTVRDPVRVNLLIRDFVRSLAGPRPGRVSWVPGPRAGAPGAARQLADRPRARAPRRRHRGGPAAAVPGRHDRLARPAPRHHRAGPPRPAPPRERRPRHGERPHRVGGRRARPARLPGDPADGRDPAGELPRLPRRRRGRALRPRDRRRGLGDRPLPAREPRAQAVALRLADRLRRLAPGARRRPRGGGADRRLQRRDGRAHRPLPAAARPVGVRRRARGPGDLSPRARAAHGPRLDARALRVRRGGCRRPARRGTASGCGPSSGGDPTSRSAW